MVRPHDASHRPPCASFPKSVDSSRRVCVARSTVPGKHGTVPLKKRPRDLGVLPRTFDPRLGPFPCRAHRNVSTPIGFLAHRNAKDESKGHHTAAISVFGDDADPTASPTKQLINPLFTLLNSSGRFQARDERQQQQIQQEHPQARACRYPRQTKRQGRLRGGAGDARVLHLRRGRVVAFANHQNRHLGRTRRGGVN
jgi:hypothetical protein